MKFARGMRLLTGESLFAVAAFARKRDVAQALIQEMAGPVAELLRDLVEKETVQINRFAGQHRFRIGVIGSCAGGLDQLRTENADDVALIGAAQGDCGALAI